MLGALIEASTVSHEPYLGRRTVHSLLTYGIKMVPSYGSGYEAGTNMGDERKRLGFNKHERLLRTNDTCVCSPQRQSFTKNSLSLSARHHVPSLDQRKVLRVQREDTVGRQANNPTCCTGGMYFDICVEQEDQSSC